MEDLLSKPSLTKRSTISQDPKELPALGIPCEGYLRGYTLSVLSPATN